MIPKWLLKTKPKRKSGIADSWPPAFAGAGSAGTRKSLYGGPYGNKRLTIKPKKAAIEVGDASNLVPTLELLKEAVEAGELDKVLMAAKEARRAQFKKAS